MFPSSSIQLSSVRSSSLLIALAIAFVGTLWLASGAHAQSRLRAGAQPAGPALGLTQKMGAPSASGLASPSANPAGLPSPSANPAGLPDPTTPNISVPGVPAGSPEVDAGVAQGGTVMGAGGAARTTVVQAAPYTAVQIARSFIMADANRDGELTRAEAAHLEIAPLSFEDMDANHDGILTRSEYENALR
jgi:hypothetical protein